VWHYRIIYFRVREQETLRISWVPGEMPLGDSQMRTGVGLFFIAVGAILIFALSAGGPHWINLQITGIVLVLAGVLGIVLPAKARASLLAHWYQPRIGRRLPGTRD
jgi:uncharacterized protein YjeT (DUF2065 family)